ncbi:Cytochrome b5-like Heme/Steroid binding domain protein [uncultured archaeon]|nr:Cytochrome b5-like Heme/Steroid binding domain protein [uncultured archaeon]
MKALFAIMLVSALLLFGCAGSQPAPQQNASGLPPAPPEGNGSVPPAPPAGNETHLGNGSNVSPPPASGITAAQLAQHNSASDCWVAYKGEVYDVTQFLPVHPGGEAKILQFCGTSDKFQAAFNMKHGTSKEAILMQQAFVGNYSG